jgi:hypothetical protein
MNKVWSAGNLEIVMMSLTRLHNYILIGVLVQHDFIFDPVGNNTATAWSAFLQHFSRLVCVVR